MFLSLLTAAFCPVAAHASPCSTPTCLITITEVGTPANTYTFTVPGGTLAPANPAATDGTSYFDLTGVAVTGPSGYSSSNDTVYFYPTTPTYTDMTGTITDFGGLWDPSLTNTIQPGDFVGNCGTGVACGFLVSDATFFSGSVSSPSFTLTPLTTTGPLINYWGSGSYNYSITAVGRAPATPEPSSLMLLGTGAMGLISAYRRRKLA